MSQPTNTLQQRFEAMLGKLHAELIMVTDQRDQAIAVARDLQAQLSAKEGPKVEAAE